MRFVSWVYNVYTNFLTHTAQQLNAHAVHVIVSDAAGEAAAADATGNDDDAERLAIRTL